MDTAQNTKIAFFEIKPWEIEEIKKQFNRYNIEFFEERLTQDNISKVKDVEIISTFIKTELSGHLLSQMPALKFISTRSTGYDHIDKEYCEANGIKVSNVPNYGANTVAEHAVSLLLAIYKRIPESSEKVRSGYFNPEGLTGLDLMGKTIGILGTGNIGQNMAKYVIAFGAHALAYDINPDQKFADLECVKYVGLEDVWAKSDVISLHLPYCDDTHHIINRDSISKMKKGVVIINTARGGLIETDALFDAIRDGHVGGAGLDVLEEEGFLAEEIELLHTDKHSDNVDFKIALENHMLAHLPNVIITPHNAFNTAEALQRIVTITIENIKSYLSGDVKNLIK